MHETRRKEVDVHDGGEINQSQQYGDVASLQLRFVQVCEVEL